MNMFKAIQAGAEAAVAADPRPLNVISAASKVTPSGVSVSAPQSGTMALIEKLVEGLPPFPLSAPLPILGTADRYASQPCSNPRPRYMPKGTCHCGFLMGEHPKGGAK
jgi:hypothetical protein